MDDAKVVMELVVDINEVCDNGNCCCCCSFVYVSGSSSLGAHSMRGSSRAVIGEGDDEMMPPTLVLDVLLSINGDTIAVGLPPNDGEDEVSLAVQISLFTWP